MSTLIPDDQTVFLCQIPVNLRWGEKKLTEFCRTKMERDPQLGGIYIFRNANLNQLKLIFYRKKLYHEIIKWLPRGSLVLPTIVRGKSTVVLHRSKLDKILSLSGNDRVP